MASLADGFTDQEVALTSAVGTPSGGWQRRSTSWLSATSLPNGSSSKFFLRSVEQKQDSFSFFFMQQSDKYATTATFNAFINEFVMSSSRFCFVRLGLRHIRNESIADQILCIWTAITAVKQGLSIYQDIRITLNTSSKSNPKPCCTTRTASFVMTGRRRFLQTRQQSCLQPCHCLLAWLFVLELAMIHLHEIDSNHSTGPRAYFELLGCVRGWL